mmetsp:Transcript_14702/g.37352  ORF Transcript_14702/g.37352 Transcript_14702/m.37352 type:complete len:84 (+) Transcript_14702:3-254(+)
MMGSTLEQAELVPASLVNFRTPTAELVQPPYLHHQLMARVQLLTHEDQQIPQGRPLVAGGAEPVPAATPALMAGPRTPQWAPR